MIRTVFIALGTLVVGLAIGIPLLGSVFGGGGAYQQLEGFTKGACVLKGGTLEYTTAGSPPPLAVDVTVPVGTAFHEIASADITGYTPATTAAGRGIFVDGTEYLIGVGTAAPAACTDAAVAEVAGAADAGNVAIAVDAYVSDSRYSGVLQALAVLLPLFVIFFFFIRFGGLSMIERLGSGGSRRARRA